MQQSIRLRVHHLRRCQHVTTDRKPHQGIKCILEGVHESIGSEEEHRVEELVLDLPGTECNLHPALPAHDRRLHIRALYETESRAGATIRLVQHGEIVEMDLRNFGACRWE